MNIMTKRGNQDNVVTYEHMCDTTADLANIDPHYITLGSIAIVLQGENDGMEIYIADSNKQWNSLSTINAGGGGGGDFIPDITNPQDGDTLVYDATAGEWVNGAASDSVEMVIPSFTAAMSPQSITCDKTYAEVYAAASQGLVPYALLTVTGMGSMTLQFDGINLATQAIAFKCSLIGTITGIIDTRQYFQVLLYFNEYSRNINIATVESESPIIIDNDPEPEPEPDPYTPS